MRYLLLILLFFILTTGCSYSYGQPVKKFIWTPIPTQNTYGGIVDITWSPELQQYIAVGGSAILHSKDGINWKNYYPSKGENTVLLSVLWANKRYIAAGLVGYILTSQNGVDWNIANSNTKQNIQSIACSGNRFIAVGSEGCIIISEDGDTWNVCNSPTHEYLYKAIWTGDKFVVTGNNGIILSSLNGIEWQIIKPSTGQYRNTVTSIIYVNNEYITVNINGDINISNDLINWTNSYQTKVSLLNILYAQNNYFAVGLYTIATSKNGHDWEISLKNKNVEFHGIAASDKNIITTGLYINSMPAVFKTNF